MLVGDFDGSWLGIDDGDKVGTKPDLVGMKLTDGVALGKLEGTVLGVKDGNGPSLVGMKLTEGVALGKLEGVELGDNVGNGPSFIGLTDGIVLGKREGTVLGREVSGPSGISHALTTTLSMWTVSKLELAFDRKRILKLGPNDETLISTVFWYQTSLA
jgi:hypothetical protein